VGADSDVLLTHNATVGRVAIVEDVDPFLLGISVSRANQSVLLNRFLIGCFALPVFQGQLNAINRNSGRTQSTMQAPTERVRRLASRHGHGDRPSGQSSSTDERQVVLKFHGLALCVGVGSPREHIKFIPHPARREEVPISRGAEPANRDLKAT
jgi:hypothetical protein